MSVETGVPRDLLASHPETVYFWGRVVGDGDLGEDSVTVTFDDDRRENAEQAAAACPVDAIQVVTAEGTDP